MGKELDIDGIMDLDGTEIEEMKTVEDSTPEQLDSEYHDEQEQVLLGLLGDSSVLWKVFKDCGDEKVLIIDNKTYLINTDKKEIECRCGGTFFAGSNIALYPTLKERLQLASSATIVIKVSFNLRINTHEFQEKLPEYLVDSRITVKDKVVTLRIQSDHELLAKTYYDLIAFDECLRKMQGHISVITTTEVYKYVDTFYEDILLKLREHAIEGIFDFSAKNIDFKFVKGYTPKLTMYDKAALSLIESLAHSVQIGQLYKNLSKLTISFVTYGEAETTFRSKSKYPVQMQCHGNFVFTRVNYDTSIDAIVDLNELLKRNPINTITVTCEV